MNISSIFTKIDYTIHISLPVNYNQTPEDGYGEEYVSISGNAKNFQQFIEKELFITTKKLFDSYIIISPSLWYKQYPILSLWKTYKQKEHILPPVLFGVGSLEENSQRSMKNDTRSLYQEYHQFHKQSSLFISYGDDHSTIFPQALTKGLLYLLEK